MNSISQWAGVALAATPLLGCGEPVAEPVAGAGPEPLPTPPSVVAPDLPPGPPEQPEGHRRMVARLAEIAEEARVDNPYFGEQGIQQARDRLASLAGEGEAPQRWFLHVYLGGAELRMGNEDASIEHYAEADRILRRARTDPPRDKRLRAWFGGAVAHLRRAQTVNWVRNPASGSHLFPVPPSGVHADLADSTRAIELLEEVLEITGPREPDHLRARWLINLAYMMQGRYPDDLAEDVLLPPEVFESDASLPRFENVAAKAGLDTFDLAGGVVIDDLNGDDHLDVMVSTLDPAGNMHLHLADGQGGYRDRTVAGGLEGMLGGLNLIHADYDNDGDVDVFVLRGAWYRQFGQHANSLLQNDGRGVFTDVTYEAGLAEVEYPTQTGAWADYDNDGDLDLYVGNESGQGFNYDGADGWSGPVPSQLFRNEGDGTFVDVAAAAGVLNEGYSKGVTWGDVNDDRFPDLYVSNINGENRLYVNNRDGTFTDVAGPVGVSRPVASFATWFWDANNDGALDLFVAASGGPNNHADVSSVAGSCLGLVTRNETSRVYLGNGRGGFVDRGAQWGLTDVTLPMGANFGDLDNDGFPDFYLGTGYPYFEGLTPNVMYLNLDGEGLADVTTVGGFGHLQKGHAIALADLDNDGDQDVFAQMGGAYRGDAAANALFENPGFGNRWIQVRLTGVTSNRSAIGARVRVDITEDGKERSVYSHVSTGGSFGSSPLRREIGLGGAERILRLEVYWPTSDTTQTFEDVGLDQRIGITEGVDELRPLPRNPVTFGR